MRGRSGYCASGGATRRTDKAANVRHPAVGFHQMTSTLFAIYERLVLAHPARVLLAMLALLGFFGWQAQHFELDASADSLMLEDDRDLQTLRELQTRYGSKDLLIVTYAPGGDVFDEASLDRLRALRDRLRSAPGVESITSILDVPLLDNVEGVSLSAIADNVRTLDDPSTDRARARGGAARESGVRGGHRERRCAHRGASAHDEGRRGVPRPALEAQPPPGCARRGGPGRRRRAPGSTPSSQVSSASTSPRNAASPQAVGPR